MSAKLIVRNIAIFLLALLWIYAAASKLVDWEHFKWEMHNQVLPDFLRDSLVFALPAAELATAILLFFERTTALGLWISFCLLTIFTVYIALVVGHAFSYVPCSCGGILTNMGWGAHLLFNLAFTALALTTIIIDRKGGSVTTMR